MRFDSDARVEQPSPDDRPTEAVANRLSRADFVWAVVVSALVAAAFVVPHFHLSWLTPLLPKDADQNHTLAGTAPILGRWLPHANWATIGAVALAAVVVAAGPIAARRLPWRPLVLLTWLGALIWTVTLTLIDGPARGWVRRMNGTGGYLAQIPRHGSVSSLLHDFASHIAASSAAPWDISIAGDPPGALVTFLGLDRIGLSGAWWASAFCVVVGTSSAAAVLVAVRVLGDESLARRAAPFVLVAPTAIWVGVSADGYFTGVAAWGLTLLALAATRSVRTPDTVAVVAGLLLGWSVYLDYGLILLAIPAVGILVAARNARPLAGTVLGALAVAAWFTFNGYWWLGGLDRLRARYWAGIAHFRPYRYWVWANFVSLTCAIGLPAATALRRTVNRTALRRRSGFHLLLIALLVVVIAADLTGLSKAETERIWLPFAVWLVAAPALFPPRTHRYLLAAQAIGAILINSLLLTSW